MQRVSTRHSEQEVNGTHECEDAGGRGTVEARSSLAAGRLKDAFWENQLAVQTCDGETQNVQCGKSITCLRLIDMLAVVM